MSHIDQSATSIYLWESCTWQHYSVSLRINTCVGNWSKFCIGPFPTRKDGTVYKHTALWVNPHVAMKLTMTISGFGQNKTTILLHPSTNVPQMDRRAASFDLWHQEAVVKRKCVTLASRNAWRRMNVIGNYCVTRSENAEFVKTATLPQWCHSKTLRRCSYRTLFSSLRPIVFVY